MDEGKALLQAICDSPQDDAPRLVYADWLDEHGQADRAELIRVQIERARLEEFEPRWCDLAARERALLDRHGSAWRSGLPAWTRKEWCWFRRGFPARLSTTINPFLKGAAGLWRSGPIDALTIRKATAANLADLAACPALGRLVRLDLSNLNQEPGADWSYSNRTNIYADGARILAASPHLGRLQALDLSYQRPDDDGLKALASSPNLGSLTELDLTCAQFHPAGVEALMDSPLSDRLTSLGLTAIRLDLGVIAALPRFSNLKRLVLQHNWPNQGPGPAILEQWTSLGLLKLDVLTLSQICPDGYRRDALGSALPPAGLRALELHDCHLDENDARHLAGTPRLASLRLLNLRQNLIGNAGAQALADSAHLAGLTVLDLRKNSITDEGALALLRSPHLGNLRLLDLKNNKLSRAVAAQLRERFGDAVRCSRPSSTTESWQQVAECYFFTRKSEPMAQVPGVLPDGKP